MRLPLNLQLASPRPEGTVKDLGYVIDVEDDGHGMTPEEAIGFYLRVGADRRSLLERGRNGHAEKAAVTWVARASASWRPLGFAAASGFGLPAAQDQGRLPPLPLFMDSTQDRHR